ncbi:MAG: flagellar biosynthetic protein FliP, partial [bacterium]|nr:flagellar biosynthetic protein FliP [bacterium]
MKIPLVIAAAGPFAQVAAAAGGGLFGVSLGQGAGDSSVSVPMQIVLLLTALTLLPAMVISVTPFLRITVVLHFLRQAMGTQTTPSNQVLVGIALFLTILIVHPVASEIYTQSWEPMESGELAPGEAMTRAAEPLKEFLMRYVREKDVQLLLEISGTPAPAAPADLGLKILVPAYVLSELKTGFQIGAVLFLPFLIIDLVVASVT